MAMPFRTFSYPRHLGTPRPGATYRGARRNAARGSVWRGALVRVSQMARPPAVRPNASRRLAPTWTKQALRDAAGKIMGLVWAQVFR